MPSQPYVVREPVTTPAPIVVDSPHSGMDWPDDFAPAAPRDAILTTWDAYVDELWSDAPAAGAALLSATFPRAYIDVNRAEDDLDPALLEDAWPGVLSPTAYSARGMGLIRRLALPDVPMYSRRLRAEEVRRRIQRYYRPYRSELRQRVERARERFGAVWYLDCHSMKSRGNEMNVDAGEERPDFVISDRHGTSADPAYATWIAGWFRGRGYMVSINEPYQGGDLVADLGAPARGIHAIQVEVNRALYLDETAVTRIPRFDRIRSECGAFLRAFTAHVTGGV